MLELVGRGLVALDVGRRAGDEDGARVLVVEGELDGRRAAVDGEVEVGRHGERWGGRRRRGAGAQRLAGGRGRVDSCEVV